MDLHLRNLRNLRTRLLRLEARSGQGKHIDARRAWNRLLRRLAAGGSRERGEEFLKVLRERRDALKDTDLEPQLLKEMLQEGAPQYKDGGAFGEVFSVGERYALKLVGLGSGWMTPAVTTERQFMDEVAQTRRASEHGYGPHMYGFAITDGDRPVGLLAMKLYHKDGFTYLTEGSMFKRAHALADPLMSLIEAQFESGRVSCFDIKPENVVVREAGDGTLEDVKLIDFDPKFCLDVDRTVSSFVAQTGGTRCEGRAGLKLLAQLPVMLQLAAIAGYAKGLTGWERAFGFSTPAESKDRKRVPGIEKLRNAYADSTRFFSWLFHEEGRPVWEKVARQYVHGHPNAAFGGEGWRDENLRFGGQDRFPTIAKVFENLLGASGPADSASPGYYVSSLGTDSPLMFQDTMGDESSTARPVATRK